MSTDDTGVPSVSGRGFALSVLVVLLSFVALAISIPTRGLSLILIPLVAAILVGLALRPAIAWAYGFPYVASFVVFGFLGLGAFPVLLVGILILLFRLNQAVAIGVTIAGLGAMLLYVDGGVVQKARSANDSSNVRQILLTIQVYHDETGGYPDRLSRLAKSTQTLRIFSSPRGAGEKQWLKVGALRIWLRKYTPGPVRQVRQWSDVDDGDYLYRNPGPDPANDAITVMTRPGLLYRNGVNVGQVDGSVQFLPERAWKERGDVVAFLDDLGLTNYLSLTTGGE